jgi:hypothetical protein
MFHLNSLHNWGFVDEDDEVKTLVAKLRLEEQHEDIKQSLKENWKVQDISISYYV